MGDSGNFGDLGDLGDHNVQMPEPLQGIEKNLE